MEKREEAFDAKQIYEHLKQASVRPIIRFEVEKKNIIIFPEQIERVAISFFQGFTKELLEAYGKEKMLNMIEIKGNEKVVKKFYSVI